MLNLGRHDSKQEIRSFSKPEQAWVSMLTCPTYLRCVAQTYVSEFSTLCVFFFFVPWRPRHAEPPCGVHCFCFVFLGKGCCLRNVFTVQNIWERSLFSYLIIVFCLLFKIASKVQATSRENRRTAPFTPPKQKRTTLQGKIPYRDPPASGSASDLDSKLFGAIHIFLRFYPFSTTTSSQEYAFPIDERSSHGRQPGFYGTF